MHHMRITSAVQTEYRQHWSIHLMLQKFQLFFGNLIHRIVIITNF